jgi:indole-3-glycerol phosphate synthase
MVKVVAEGTYLERIVGWHLERARNDQRKLEQLMEGARRSPRSPSFSIAIGTDDLSLIAECKRRSPSRGDLNIDLVPSEIAVSYRNGGASALSVLTDTEHFHGSVDDLKEVRSVVDIPILRKDFTVDPRDIADAKIMGASAVLLIVAALDPIQLEDYLALTQELELDALVEVHDAKEIEVALEAGASIVGINQRNLHDFSIDTSLASSLRSMIPVSVLSVAESGIMELDQVSSLAKDGFSAVLVGEALVTSGDPEGQSRRFVTSGIRR